MITTWRRIVAATAALVLTGTLAACSESESDAPTKLDDKRAGAMADYAAGTQFKASEPLNFSFLFSDHPNYPYKKNWLFFDELTKRTNVTLDMTTVPMSDYEQKRSLLIGSGDAPMIIAKTYPGQESPFVSSGAILPVSKYLDLMPNFQNRIKEWGLEPNLDGLRQADGEFYVLPGVHQAPNQDYTVAVRTDELKRLNLATPKNWDEFRDVLRAIKKAHPNVYPMSDRFEGQNLLGIVGLTYGAGAGWGYNNATWNESAKSFEFTGTSPQYKELVTYLHSLIEEKLLDPESFTQDDESATQKLAKEKSYAISTNAQNIVNDYRPALSKVPGATVAKLPLPAGPIGNVINGSSKLENGIMINAKAAESPNFVAMMQFIDWMFYSDQAGEFTKWGVEGTTYTKSGDTRKLNTDITMFGLNPGAPKQLQKDYGFSGGNFAYGGTTELTQSMFTQEEKDFQATLKDKEVLPLPPPFPFDEDQAEQATLLDTPLTDFVNQATLRFILGQRPLSDWDAYVAEVKAKGSDRYLTLVNEAHKTYAEGKR